MSIWIAIVCVGGGFYLGVMLMSILYVSRDREASARAMPDVSSGLGPLESPSQI